MHFTVAKNSLVSALQRCAAIASGKSSVPILSHVLLQPMEGACIITATDLELGYTTAIDLTWKEITPADCFQKIALPAKKLLEIIKVMPVEAIDIFTLGNQVYTISGGTAKFVIHGLDPDEYPHIDAIDGEQITILAKNLHQAIAPVSYCQSKDATKPNLAGILFKLEENVDGDIFIVTAACDGHRICLNSTPLATDEEEPETLKPVEYSAELAKGVVIPTKAAAEIMHLQSDGIACITMAGNNLCISIGDEQLTIRLASGGFPDISRVIPEKQTSRIIAKRQSLLDAIARVKIATDKENTRGITVRTETDQLVLSGSLVGYGIEAHDFVSVEIIGDLEPFVINAEYLLQALSNIHTTSIELLFVGSIAPMMIMPSGTDFPQSVIMPMRRN